MAKALTRLLTPLEWPGRLLGPIFLKELRVSSRRGRNYVLRLAYVVILAGFVTLIWLAMVTWPSDATLEYRVSRMAEAGKMIVRGIVWFQFIAAQLLAMLLLSTAISGELTQGTLGVLMSTPIGGWQIVLGKLFSNLWQILILVAISMPLMMVVRVFGGVPVEFVAAGVGITLTTAILLGSASLYLSVYNSRVHIVVIKTVALATAMFALVPLVFIMMRPALAASATAAALLYYANPYFAMVLHSLELGSPGLLPAARFYSWPLHCLIMLAGAAGFLWAAARSARRAALAQATGGAQLSVPRPGPGHVGGPPGAAPEEAASGAPRRVAGSPIVWKDLRASLFASRRVGIAGFGIMAGGAGLTYAVCGFYGLLDDRSPQIMYVWLFLLIGAVYTGVLAAASITSEKESRCWPLLLATTMGDGRILLGKAAGVVGRSLPVWLLLLGHVVVFGVFRCIHPITIAHVGILAIYVVVFLTGLGLYFSARFRRGTAAVTATIGVAGAIWAVMPLLLPVVLAVSPGQEDLGRRSLAVNPLVQATVLVEGTTGAGRAWLAVDELAYQWPWPQGPSGAGGTTLCMLGNMAFYILLGLLLGWRAKKRLRRDIFQPQ